MAMLLRVISRRIFDGEDLPLCFHFPNLLTPSGLFFQPVFFPFDFLNESQISIPFLPSSIIWKAKAPTLASLVANGKQIDQYQLYVATK